ncbi:hypothetical protein [Candidatus Magnetomonas plexicatena]|uniref:hypothetical protein n=1 Tax=Candidatus Magnetomonas plexicatena TaxID=2552947 RepID=UPI001100DD44|nr:hypothetical protein E2O03_015635 [Nitrospirales bacterium LBB_01]
MKRQANELLKMSVLSVLIIIFCFCVNASADNNVNVTGNGNTVTNQVNVQNANIDDGSVVNRSITNIVAAPSPTVAPTPAATPTPIQSDGINIGYKGGSMKIAGTLLGIFFLLLLFISFTLYFVFGSKKK